MARSERRRTADREASRRGSDRRRGAPPPLAGAGDAGYAPSVRRRSSAERGRPNRLKRVLLALLVVLVVGAVFFLIGYLIGLKLAVVTLLLV